jgi:endoglucanase
MKRYENSLWRSRIVRLGRDAMIAAAALGAAIGATRAANPKVVNESNPIPAKRLFVESSTPARKQADAWRRSRPADAALMERIASQPVAKWLNEWAGDVRAEVARYVSAAASQGATPVLVAYDIPNRDCGSYSAGGSASTSAYGKWIRQFAAGLGGSSSVVILEPDAVAGASCLSASAREQRFSMLRDAIQVLKSAHAVVYLDGGNATWLSADAVASRLRDAGIDQADGFALNVSNYISTSRSISYGDQVSKLVGGKHYVIDTSRNGAGGRGDAWCNVPGQALGELPTTNTGRALVDAYLWIKVPGESDGTCNGGPHSGAWWPEYALELARNEST